MKEDQQKQNLDKFIDMVKGANICMMITQEKNAKDLSGRPMSIAKVDEEGSVWFFTRESYFLVDEIDQDKKVSLSITDESNSNYLMIHGKALLSADRTQMENLWNPMLKVWFPDGVKDPEMMLIQVIPDKVDYWDSNSSKMVQLFNMAKAIVKGKEYGGGERGKMDL